MIKIIDIDYETIVRVIFKNKRIGQGSYGTVYVYDDNHLIKFENQMLNSGTFPSEGEIFYYFNNKSRLNNKIENLLFSTDVLKQQNYLTMIQNKVKSSTFPQAIAYFQGRPAALILKYHKDYEPLSRLDLGYQKTIDLLDEYRYRQDELIAHGVFSKDVENNNNILYREKDGDMQLIDFDSNQLYIGEANEELMTKYIYVRLYQMNKYYAENYVLDKKLLREKLIDSKLDDLTLVEAFDDKTNKIKKLVKEIGVRK